MTESFFVGHGGVEPLAIRPPGYNRLELPLLRTHPIGIWRVGALIALAFIAVTGMHWIHVSCDRQLRAGQIPSALSAYFDFLSPKTTKAAPGFPRRLSFALLREKKIRL